MAETQRRGWKGRAVDVAMGCLIAAALVEVGVRVWNPMPRTQVVRQMSGITLTTLDGLPAWNIAIGAELANADCLQRPHDRVVGFVGDSIFVTSPGNTAAEVFTERLQAKIDASGLPWCVVNVSRPGFTGPLKAAAAKELLASTPVDLLVYGVWNEDGDPWRLGDAVFELALYARDADGYPVIPWLPLPAFVHRPLFRSSAAWQFAVLTLGHDRPTPEVQRERNHRAVGSVLDAAQVTGTEVWVVQLPRLDAPFAQTADTPQAARADVLAYAQARGAHGWVLAQDLVGQEVQALRLDTCCHYNDVGHGALADVFYRRLQTAWPVQGDDR